MKSSYAFGGMAAIAIVAFAIGFSIEQGPSEETRAPTQPEQQMAKPITDPDVLKEVTGPGPVSGGGTGEIDVDTGSGTGGTSVVEICGNHIDDDGDGRIDEAPPPAPGVNWIRCDISGDDYTGEDLRGAQMIGIIAVGTILNEADLTGVDARGGDFYDAEIQNAIIVGGQFQRANLYDTDFRYSNLINAIFDNAEMNGAILNEADLSNARFDGITFTETMYSDSMRTDDYTAPSDFTISNTGLKLLVRDSILQDTIFENVVLENFKIHRSSLANLDLQNVIVNTGYTVDFWPFNEEGWYYNVDSNLDCINHVVCDEPGPGLFRDIHQVTPLPEHFEEVRIGNYPYPGHYEDICYRNGTCYVPQVATVLKGGTVTWFNDSVRASDDSDVPYKLVSGTPEDGPDGIFESPNIAPGETWSRTFPTVGKFYYYDEYDTNKIGQVIVFGKLSSGEPDKPDQGPPPEKPGNNPSKPAG